MNYSILRSGLGCLYGRWVKKLVEINTNFLIRLRRTKLNWLPNLNLTSCFNNWLKAIRAPFFTASVVPVTLGTTIAWNKAGQLNWLYLGLSLIGVLLLHAGTNLANDYFDHRTGNDGANTNPTPFSGGSRAIQNGEITPGKVLCVSLIAFGLGIGIGLYLNYVCDRNIVLLLGIIGVFLGFFYTAWPFRIGYRGIGECVVGLGFGPLIVEGAYYVQTQSLSWIPFLASLPVAVLISLVLYINEFPDYEADKAVNKRTLIVILGKHKAIKLYSILLLLTYTYIILGIRMGLFPLFALVTLLTVPLCLKIIRVAIQNFNKIYELLPANVGTIKLHLIIGLLLSASYILDKLATIKR